MNSCHEKSVLFGREMWRWDNITGKELAEYCKKSDCDSCEHENLCKNFNEYMSEYAPFVLLESDEMIKRLSEHEF